MKAISCLISSGFITVASSFSGDSLKHVVNSRKRSLPSCSPLQADKLPYNIQEAKTAEALVFLEQAKALRSEASQLQQKLKEEKEERLRNEIAKVDSLIDSLLFHGTTNYYNDQPESSSTSIQITERRSKQQLMNTEEQVAQLLISRRMNYDQVNQMFDRIVAITNRPQSIDSCSPLLSLLLDAACKVDCLEREDNPNKRWNHRVERDLRRKLFALGYGIRIEDVQKKNDVRSITGEKDYY